jgi:hypothetical protein
MVLLRIHGSDVTSPSLLSVTLKRFRSRASSVLFLTRGVRVKYGQFQHLSDAAAMQSSSDILTYFHNSAESILRIRKEKDHIYSNGPYSWEVGRVT